MTFRFAVGSVSAPGLAPVAAHTSRDDRPGPRLWRSKLIFGVTNS